MREVICCAVATVVLSLPTPASAQAQPLTGQTPPVPIERSAEAAARELRALEETLTNPASSPQQRDEAASRLVSRQSREADEILSRVLGTHVNPEGQLAVARALANDPEPDPMFIGNLEQTLAGSREMTDNAARALANYKNSDQARNALQRFASNRTFNDRQRSAALRAMGRLVDKQTAAFLMGLLSDSQESQIVRDAAGEALGRIADLDYGNDVQRWQDWWARNQNRPEFEWVMDRLDRNATQKNVLEQRIETLHGFAERLFAEKYAAATDEEKPNVVLVALKSDSLDARLMGVNLVFQQVGLLGSAGLYQRVADPLRGMVGDSSPRVREAVARTLGSAGAGDAQVVDAILAQLPQETNKEVLSAMLFALGNSDDLRTVEPLLQRLNDASYSVAEAAAQALARKAQLLQEPANSDLAQTVAARLSRRLAETRTERGAEELRQDIVSAMAQLGHPSLYQDFVRLTSLNEQVQIRGRAYQGLGAIGNPEAETVIARGLNDPDAGVRSRAIEALRAIGSFNSAATLARYITPAGEPNENNREDAWQALLTLFSKAPDAQALSTWAEQFKPRNPTELDHFRREKILSIMETKHAAALPNRPDLADDLAYVRTNRGEALLELARLEKSVPNQRVLAEIAAEKLGQALEYHVAANAMEATTAPLMQQRLQAMLIARKYTDAMAFAQGISQQQRGFLETTWQAVLKEAARLRDARDYPSALSLLDEARKLPWEAVLAKRLEGFREQIQILRDSGGQVWFSPYLATRGYPINPSLPWA